MKNIFRFIALMMVAAWAQATPIDTYEFKTQEAQERGTALAAELRCPQCQNQNLIDSNSPIAKDMRLMVYEMVEEGKSNEEIVGYFTERYGDFVRYRPSFDSRTYVLWLGPLAFLLIGGTVGFFFVRAQRKQAAGKVEVSADDQARLAKMLEQEK